jgi:hypothetical protein
MGRSVGVRAQADGTTYSPRCSFRTEAMAWAERELKRVVIGR